MKTLEDRVAELERSARRWRAAAIVTGVTLVAGVGLAAQRTGEQRMGSLSVERLSVGPQNGPRVEITADEDMAEVHVRGTKGGEVWLSSGLLGSSVTVYGKAGQREIKDLKPVALLTTSDDGAEFELRDRDFKPTFKAPAKR